MDGEQFMVLTEAEHMELLTMVQRAHTELLGEHQWAVECAYRDRLRVRDGLLQTLLAKLGALPATQEERTTAPTGTSG